MKKIYTLIMMLSFAFIAFTNQSHAQVWGPEGVSMPGSWNTWANPPTNALALASATQVPGGQVALRTTGDGAQYHTIIHAAASGADVVGGTYEWLFTSGATGSEWSNKWNGVAVTMNTIQDYSYQHPDNNTITVLNDMWYAANFEDIGYSNNRAIIMATSAEPVEILSVSEPATVMPNDPVNVSVTVDNSLSPEEMVYICYTTDNWGTASAVLASMTGTSGTATIPGQVVNTGVKYYAFTSTISNINADFGLQAIDVNNNGGVNYSYDIGTPPPPTVDWANLQWPGDGTIDIGTDYNVYGQIYINGVTDPAGPGVDIQAWVGYSLSDTDPSTWSNWVPATFNTEVGNNDEYVVNLGTSITQPGSYYYATRYQYQNQAYVYGGFQGGFWDGTTNVSGTLTVNSTEVPLSNWSFLLIGFLAIVFVVIKVRK
ncbi:MULTISPECIES: hypothetical protein [unclassified Lentimicrobium]|uniref:hypothetical protein n=1 Tax=unclassified Lentimicrobium TaxID=2677434 RepID=UPI001556ABB9|nr:MULTISPECIES: hypothetical protein [unclassified Lentimicrobium]NPD46332.1 hypothetical protein [Lentimicrobium sp. S6]NPD85028.1 hypothetical protein [Lentimicrobium sp. L6]